MKIFLLLFIIVPVISLCQPKGAIILQKENKPDFYHVVYIDARNNSPEYRSLSDLSFKDFDKEEYNSILKRLKKKNGIKRFSHADLKGLPHKWCTLNLYKGKYYVYSPSDYGNHYNIRFTDSIIVEKGFEIDPSVIHSFKKVDAQTFVIRRILSHDNKQNTLIIHLLKQLKGAAIFENSLYANTGKYILMVDINYIKQYSVIVNYCKTEKTPEFAFQQPDYK